MLKLRINLDPTIQRVCAIGLLTFLEVFLGALIVVFQKDQYPTILQVLTITMVSCLTLVTYFLTFLKKEDGEK